MDYRMAGVDDAPLLAWLNKQLIVDEGHANPMTVTELEARMRAWLAGAYTAVLFTQEGDIVVYALYRPEGDGIYLRHLFVVGERRRQGFGRQAMELLLTRVWPPGTRVTVEALVHNAPALAFYRAVGFGEYALTLKRQAGPLGDEEGDLTLKRQAESLGDDECPR